MVSGLFHDYFPQSSLQILSDFVYLIKFYHNSLMAIDV